MVLLSQRLQQVRQQVRQPVAAPHHLGLAWEDDPFQVQWMVGQQRVRSLPAPLQTDSAKRLQQVAPVREPPPRPPGQGGGGGGGESDPPGLDNTNNHGDLFGGNGLFEDLRLLGLGLAACGLLPLTFRPVRFSFHPTRSTLLYSLGVTLAVCWSGWRLVTDRLELFETRRRVTLHTRFTAVVGIGSMTGLCMTPLLWLEARHVRRHLPAAAELMRTFGSTFHRSPSRRSARTLSRCSVAMLVLSVPASEAMWLYLLAPEGGHWTHIFAHNQVLVLPIFVSGVVAGSAYCVKRFADALRAAMSKELEGPCLAAARVDAYRRAWLQLRELTERLVRTPLTANAMLLHMLLMSTLATYQALVGLREGEVTLALLLFMLGTQYYLLLLLVCDAVHRAVEAVRTEAHRNRARQVARPRAVVVIIITIIIIDCSPCCSAAGQQGLLVPAGDVRQPVRSNRGPGGGDHVPGACGFLYAEGDCRRLLGSQQSDYDIRRHL
ncbi:Gustatory and odorant receptor 24 [Frankliniella fusca]|uniref:Gustatory and odorant receptor 24 n=1 Tax=Frankliniella fusca TaxID=407009 RepID=A0AAE1HLU5_9NEOP|nr:Gustatory and odorant receptor 24 [Frankliniella fusca]